MARHSHKHTHNLGDGNNHPVHEPVEHDHEHDDGPTPTHSRHHAYAEEPAVVVVGPITPGLWQCALDAASGTPRVYVRRDDQTEEVIAKVVRLPDSGGQHRAVANAKLLTFSPALLRFVQNLAEQQGGGVLPFRNEALNLIDQLNEVEVISVADRW